MSATLATRELLAARAVNKRFGATQAVQDVSVELAAGEIHGLIGPNGAGKSTLVGILTGQVHPDEGHVELRGVPVRLRSAREALRLGIVTVPQELAVPAALPVSQVITLGAEPARGGFVSRRRERDLARSVLDRLELSISPSTQIGDLLPSEQKAVVVAQALHRNAVALLLDEPTAGMASDHAEPLLKLLERLRQQDIAVLYISHRLAEVERLCSTVSVMRDGRKVSELTADQTHHGALREHLERGNEQVRTTTIEQLPATSSSGARPSVTVGGLASRRVADVSFTVEPGEILGLAGLPGSGVEDVFAALAGLAPGKAGFVRVGDEPVRSPIDAVRAGVGYLPPNRAAAILVEEGVSRNMVLTSLSALSRWGLITARREREAARPFAAAVAVAPLFDRRMRQLSGGNQQRVLFGRLLFSDSRVLVLEGPTVGVDVTARRSLHALLGRLAAEGRTCIVGSDEPEELVTLCHKVLVFRAGSVVGELGGQQLTERALLSLMTGGEARDLER